MNSTPPSGVKRWRLLLHGAADGAYNMGVDEAMLRRAAREGLASFRLYSWQGPWLSLGYPQQLSPERMAACKAAGVGLVKRVTGGRAVLHGGDLTYAVAAPTTALPGNLQQSYAVLAKCLVQTLRTLGAQVSPSAADAPAPSRAVFDCFAQPAAHELCIAGRKLAGSAQRRWRGALLQHGSLRLRPDALAVQRACGGAGRTATSLSEEGIDVSEAALREAWVEHFAQELHVEWEESQLSESERSEVRERCGSHRVNPLEMRALSHSDDSRASFSGR